MKLLFLAVLFSSLFAAKSNAQNVPASISHSFTASFPYADKATWTNAGKLFRAEFNIDQEKHFAFFNYAGDLVALSHYIDFSNLPHNLRLGLIKQFPDHNIVEMFEVQSETDTDYFVTLERNGIKFILKSAQQRKWKLFPEVK